MRLKQPGRPKNRLGKQGFTIIEVLIALAIFSIGILAVASMQTRALSAANSSRKTTQALTLANAKAEELISLPFYADNNGIDDDNDGTVDNHDVMPPLAAGNHDDNSDATGQYHIFWRVRDDAPLARLPAAIYGQPLTRSKTIRVWVTPDSDTSNRRASLEFIKVWATDEQ